MVLHFTITALGNFLFNKLASGSLPGLQRDISKIRSDVAHSCRTPQRIQSWWDSSLHLLSVWPAASPLLWLPRTHNSLHSAPTTSTPRAPVFPSSRMSLPWSLWCACLERKVHVSRGMPSTVPRSVQRSRCEKLPVVRCRQSATSRGSAAKLNSAVGSPSGGEETWHFNS